MEERGSLQFDALVLGGGIAGLQAALDLGDQGFKWRWWRKTPPLAAK